MAKAPSGPTRQHYQLATTGSHTGAQQPKKFSGGGKVGHGEAGAPKKEPSLQRYGNGFRKVKP